MKKSLSIGNRIILACMAIVIISVCAFALYFDHRRAGEIAQNLDNKVQEGGGIATQTISSWLSGRISLVENLRDVIADKNSTDDVRFFISRKALSSRMP